MIPFPGPRASKPTVSSNRLAEFEQLLELPTQVIAQVLAAAESDVVLLALAGATPRFMQRFNAMLERQDARLLQARLKKLGPINLRDVDEAQFQLCRLAEAIAQEMQTQAAVDGSDAAQLAKAA